MTDHNPLTLLDGLESLVLILRLGGFSLDCFSPSSQRLSTNRARLTLLHMHNRGADPKLKFIPRDKTNIWQQQGLQPAEGQEAWKIQGFLCATTSSTVVEEAELKTSARGTEG